MVTPNDNMEQNKKEVSLILAAIITAMSTVAVFIAFVSRDYGIQNMANIFGEPMVFRSYIAQAIGGSILLPALNVAVISLFKSKRNPSARRRVFIGWSVVIIVLQVLTGFLSRG
ncbi:hypothetical protein [Ectopseudomonas khazarica]|uniref:hypothetical protein n=1 Tax=Ectopseudomonas khazarica TaxID=2502979 RepID=UPI0037C6424F